MNGYKRAKRRFTTALKCAGEDELAKRIEAEDWIALKEASKIYNDLNQHAEYDIQTLRMGMHLLPFSRPDAIKIIEQIMKVDDRSEIHDIYNFVENITPETSIKCAEAIQRLVSDNDSMAYYLLECINYVCAEEETPIHRSMEKLPSLTLSFV